MTTRGNIVNQRPAAARLGRFYDLFGQRRFDQLGQFLAPDVWYSQLNSMTAANSPHGVSAVVSALSQWGTWVPDMSIIYSDLRPLPDDVGKAGGAEYCFEAMFILNGHYRQPIPNLRLPLQCDGAEKNMAMIDRVWMDGGLRILRIMNGFVLDRQ